MAGCVLAKGPLLDMSWVVTVYHSVLSTACVLACYRLALHLAQVGLTQVRTPTLAQPMPLDWLVAIVHFLLIFPPSPPLHSSSSPQPPFPLFFFVPRFPDLVAHPSMAVTTTLRRRCHPLVACVLPGSRHLVPIIVHLLTRSTTMLPRPL